MDDGAQRVDRKSLTSLIRVLVTTKLNRAYLRGAFWAALEGFGYPGLVLLATPFLYRYLGSEQFGQLMLVYAYGAFSFATNPGVGTATIKYVSEYVGKGDIDGAARIIGAGFVLTLLGAALLASFSFFAAPILARTVFDRLGGEDELKNLVYLAILYAGSLQVDSVFASALKGFERFGESARLDLGIRGLGLLLSTFAAFFLQDVTIVVYIQTLAFVISGLAKFFYIRSKFGGGIAAGIFDGMKIRELWAFGKWAWLHNVAGTAFGSIDRFVIGAYLGASSVANYTVSLQLAQLVHQFPAVILSISLPIVSRTVAQGGDMNLRKVCFFSVVISTFSATFLFFLLYFGGEIFLLLWTGKFIDQFSTLMLLAGGFFLLSFSIGPYFLMLGLGRSKFVYTIIAISGLISVMALPVFTKTWGVDGAAFCRCIYALGALLLFKNISRY